MKKSSFLFFIIILFLTTEQTFNQEKPEFQNNHEFESIEHMPISLEIDKLTNCPVEIVSLNLGKIKVREFTDGGTNQIRKMSESFSVKPAIIKAFFWDVVPVIKWFHRIRKQETPERKTVSIVIEHPENKSKSKIKLWYAWPSEITIKQNGPFPDVYITFEAEQVEIEYPEK